MHSPLAPGCNLTPPRPCVLYWLQWWKRKLYCRPKSNTVFEVLCGVHLKFKTLPKVIVSLAFNISSFSFFLPQPALQPDSLQACLKRLEIFGFGLWAPRKLVISIPEHGGYSQKNLHVSSMSLVKCFNINIWKPKES